MGKPKGWKPPKFRPHVPGMPVYVIAGDRREFDHWIKEQDVDPALFTYLYEENQLRGIGYFEMIHIGSWHKNKFSNSSLWHYLVEIGVSPSNLLDDLNRVVVRR